MINFIRNGLIGMTALLGLYFLIVSTVSGWEFAKEQFSLFWYFIVALAFGFGIQITLYSYLRNKVQHNTSGKVLAVSGTTSTAAMISCCAHYLANILPVLAGSGVIALVGQLQTELFWVGLLLNAGGIAYITKQIVKFHRT